MIRNACAVAFIGIAVCLFCLPTIIRTLIAGAVAMGAN